MKHNWEYKQLGDICDKGSSNLMQKNLEIIDDGFEVFGASGCLGKIDFYQQEAPYVGIVKDGSGVGRCNLYPAKSSLLGTMQYILAKNCVTNEFLCYLIQSLNLSKYVNGAAIPHIYFRDYKKEIVPVPPLEEQTKIVAELNKINETIEDCRELLRNLDALSQSLFYDFFGDPFNNPKGFSIVPLSDVFSLITDGTHQTPTYTSDIENGVKFLSAKDVVNGYIEWDNIKYIPYDLHVELHRRLAPQRGDILLCKNGTTGICALVETDEIFDIYVSLALLRPKTNTCAKYIVYAINNPFTKEQFNHSLKGIGVPNLHLNKIRSTKIILPPLELQKKFAERIELIDAQKKDVESTIAELQTLLDSRMDYWFN